MPGNLWTSPLGWTASLESPPKLHNIGFGTHGDLPRERYRLPKLWCVHLYRYVGEALMDGKSCPIRPGFAGVTPPDTDLEHVWYHRESTHITVHFSLPESAADVVTLPAMQNLGGRAEEIYAELSDAIGLFSTQRRRAEVIVWKLLWHLSDARSEENPAPTLHAVVRQALRIIETHLAEPLSIAAIAQECGVSHNHLTRCFRASMDQTVVGYIGQRRVDRARHLLIHSTLPIKAVASQVGLPDLHLFNKTIRRETGLSPRRVREKHQIDAGLIG